MTIPLSRKRSTNPVAQLGNSHGYYFEGDLAHLNAEVVCDESRLAGQTWALQLWSDESVKIADLPLGELQTNGSGYVSVIGSTTILPPAGQGAHSISLALVSGNDTVEDSANYPQAVQFVQPRLQGTVCCSFVAEQITLDIERIENPRLADNVSGTLALELWALDAAYAGADWAGIPVASVVLGTLNGQGEWSACRVTTHAGPLPASGHLTLMLREWTPAGYVTRDYRELARPSTLAAVEAEVAIEEKPKAAKKTKASAKKDVKSKEESKVSEKPAKATGVSVNTASEAELTAVKGISDAVARAIIAARPFASLDDLVRAKGMGAKLLEKVRGEFKL